MKPTGAAKEAMDQAVELIDGASNWSDVEYLVTPKVAALFDERGRLREALRQARQCITGHVCIINWSDTTREIQTREAQRVVELIDAVLNDATPSTSAGGDNQSD